MQVFCAPVLDATETAADDSSRDVDLTVSNSIVTTKGLSVAPQNITLHLGESVALPAPRP